MSFLESLFLYNILEALIIMLFCNVLSGDKFNFKDLKYCYFLGAINLSLQYINLLILNSVFQLIYNLFVMFVIMPCVAFVYLHRFYNYKILYCFYSCVFIFITSTLLTNVFNSILNTIFVNTFVNKYYEFIFNISLRVFQLLLIYLLYKGKCIIMKKILKKIASMSVEQAFTAMNQYQPKVPTKLAKEIAEKQ